ncbi:unnamed protein product [Vitrella brassicaformis CCMP3155]|uniref:Uncharacterized protein n=1 Tax=Vitrella brassicaformis (strain CCMP3155) TaxID=1169540 RepID=A0A0G4EGT9_VITBC|nr:unnamed protein product [Vitrella brassicaformis CCMP3155]|eukprot:CEL94720.1 unnamed protein product [Vitrella brassicaformis CCMP3155]
MWGLLHTQRSPRVQGQEGDSVRDGHRRPSGVDEACYIQLPRVDEGDAAAQQAIHHTQTDHPKMASASSEHIPLLLDDGQGMMEPQLPDVTDDITKAPRRFEQVPLVGAPAADEWEATDALKDSIKKAIDASDVEGLRKALDGLSPEQTEKVLTTGYGYHHDSAIHYAAWRSSSVAVFEVLLDNRRHLLNLKDGDGDTPLHWAARKGSVGVVEKFVEWGGKELLEARDNDGWTPLHRAAGNRHVDVVEWMLRVNPQLLRIKNKYGRTPLDFALEESYVRANDPKFVGAMFAVAGAVAMELLGTNDQKLESVLRQPELLPDAVACAKHGFVECLRRSQSPGLDTLRWCTIFRKLMASRPQDSLTDDLAEVAGWLEAITARFCTDTREKEFKESLKGGEEKFLELLEAAEPLEVVTQANCVSLITHRWQQSYYFNDITARCLPNAAKFCAVEFSPRSAFFSRVLSMLLMVAFVLLHIESIKGDSGMMMAGVWLWGAVLTGIGFILQEAFQGIRLKAAYWADSWNNLDCAAAVSIAAFIAVHFLGYSAEAEVSSGIVIALLFALRLLQVVSITFSVAGPLILAVVKMLSDIRNFLLLYIYILLVFAGVFTVLSSDEDHQYFGSFPKATLTLFYAGLGEFSEALTNAIESHDTLGAVLLFTYVILSSIILASTYAAIEEKQTSQYQLLRVRVLNEYLNMPKHERLPPPFNLIAFCGSAPLRHFASFIRGCQSRLCRVTFWSMVALYSLIDAFLFTVAFTPAFLYCAVERVLLSLQKRDYLQNKDCPCFFSRSLHRYTRTGDFFQSLWNAIVLTIVTPFTILFFFLGFVLQAFGVSQHPGVATATVARVSKTFSKDSIDAWIAAADSHNATSPDIMTVLQGMDKRLRQMDERQMQMDERLTQVDRRLGEMETQIKRNIR